MRIESSYPAPVLGVSTLAPRNRLDGQAERQVNFRSDPVNKLIRRPPMKWVNALLNNIDSDNLLHHQYQRDGDEYRLILNKDDGVLYTFINNELSATLQTPEGYVGSNMVAQTVENKTYFVNTDKTIEMTDELDIAQTSDRDRKIALVSYINVVSALNYGETVTITARTTNGEVIGTARVEIPEVTGTNYSEADEARATNKVAARIASELDKGSIHAKAKGSNVAVVLVLRSRDTDIDLQRIQLEVSSGQGSDECITFNEVVESVEGLPKYAVVGSRITVRPNPASDKGTYYLNATAISDGREDARGWWWDDYLDNIEEVVWTESRNPAEPAIIDNTTTPFVCVEDNGQWSIDNLSFKDRQTGDNKSNKLPKFVNSTITNISYMQKRLVLVTDNSVIMSETDDELNFWRQSVVQLLVTDPVSVSSSAAGIDKLEHIVPHNKDLLITASNGQFKIDGSVAITPQTIAMPLTTAYECQMEVAPVSLGSTVMLPMDYGTSSGLQEYSSESNKDQDFALPITDHVVGLIKGKLRLLKASTNLEMLVAITDYDNTVYVYEQHRDQKGNPTQRAWCSWELNSTAEILDISFVKDRLSLICKEGNRVILKEIDMYSKVATGEHEVYLDDMLRIPTDGNGLTLPEGYRTDDLLFVRGDGTDYELNLIDTLIEGNQVTFEEGIGTGIVYVGRRITSTYRPTRPFHYTEDGVITTDPIRINKYILHLVETNTVKMSIISDYYSGRDQVFNSRYLGSIGSKLGEVPFLTGDAKFSYSQKADQALAEFYCDNHLGCTIAGISWEGQYYQSKRRM